MVVLEPNWDELDSITLRNARIFKSSLAKQEHSFNNYNPKNGLYHFKRFAKCKKFLE